jgi:hypothetical protein
LRIPSHQIATTCLSPDRSGCVHGIPTFPVATLLHRNPQVLALGAKYQPGSFPAANQQRAAMRQLRQHSLGGADGRTSLGNAGSGSAGKKSKAVAETGYPSDGSAASPVVSQLPCCRNLSIITKVPRRPSLGSSTCFIIGRPTLPRPVVLRSLIDFSLPGSIQNYIGKPWGKYLEKIKPNLWPSRVWLPSSGITSLPRPSGTISPCSANVTANPKVVRWMLILRNCSRHSRISPRS